MSIRDEYKTKGVAGFYQTCGASYLNPHEAVVEKIVREVCAPYRRVLDLACGTGEVTRALPGGCDAVGVDPYLWREYQASTGKLGLRKSFEEIASQGLSEVGWVDAVVCSFALHLAPKGTLKTLLYQLSLVGRVLVVIGPSKLPVIEHWAWELQRHEVWERVHLRCLEIHA